MKHYLPQGYWLEGCRRVHEERSTGGCNRDTGDTRLKTVSLPSSVKVSQPWCYFHPPPHSLFFFFPFPFSGFSCHNWFLDNSNVTCLKKVSTWSFRENYPILVSPSTLFSCSDANLSAMPPPFSAEIRR